MDVLALVIGVIVASIVAARLLSSHTSGVDATTTPPALVATPVAPPHLAGDAPSSTALPVGGGGSLPIAALTSGTFDAGAAGPSSRDIPATSRSAAAPTPSGRPRASPTPDPRAPLALAATFSLGQSLCDLAVDDDGRHLYVADDGAERLLTLDAATGQPTSRIDVHDSLCSIALDQQGQTVYAPTWHRAGPGKYDSSQIGAITLGSGAIRAVPDDRFPSGPYFDAGTRTLYVGDTAQPTLFSLNTETGVAATLPVAVHVNRVAVSSKTGRLYLASPRDDKVVVYDPTAGKVVASLHVGQRPWGVAADPQTGVVLVSSELSEGVALLDPATDQVVRTTPTGGHPRNLAVDGEHGRFYVLNAADRTVSVVATDGALLSTSPPLPGSEEPSGLAVAPRTSRVFVATKTHVYVLR